MSAHTIFRGRNVVLTLVALLLYLVISSLQTNDSTLSKILVPKASPIPSTTTEQLDENIIKENDPKVATDSAQSVEGASIGRQIGQVVKVIDGDTIEVEIGGLREKIRIIGLDTPETVDPRRGVQCFGREASNFAKQLLSGKTVYLEADPTQSERDKYARLLRFVFLNEGSLDFGKLMIQEGYGREYTYDLPYKYQTDYKKAEQEAQKNKRGLWAENICT